MLKKPEFHRRQIPLFILLGLVFGVWVYTLVDGYMMRNSLKNESVEAVAKAVSGYNTEAGVESVQVISANRDYVLFGPTRGSVITFFKVVPDVGEPTYSGVEVQFEQQDGHWVMTNSGVLDGQDLDGAPAAFGDPA